MIIGTGLISRIFWMMQILTPASPRINSVQLFGAGLLTPSKRPTAGLLFISERPVCASTTSTVPPCPCPLILQLEWVGSSPGPATSGPTGRQIASSD